MISYRLFVDSEAIEFLNNIASQQRRVLWNTLLAIKENPTAYSDSSVYDPIIGMLLHISGFRNFKITYWIDDADQHVKILTLEKL